MAEAARWEVPRKDMLDGLIGMRTFISFPFQYSVLKLLKPVFNTVPIGFVFGHETDWRCMLH
jgi:hypothetical protein